MCRHHFIVFPIQHPNLARADPVICLNSFSFLDTPLQAHWPPSGFLNVFLPQEIYGGALSFLPSRLSQNMTKEVCLLWLLIKVPFSPFSLSSSSPYFTFLYTVGILHMNVFVYSLSLPTGFKFYKSRDFGFMFVEWIHFKGVASLYNTFHFAVPNFHWSLLIIQIHVCMF